MLVVTVPQRLESCSVLGHVSRIVFVQQSARSIEFGYQTSIQHENLGAVHNRFEPMSNGQHSAIMEL